MKNVSPESKIAIEADSFYPDADAEKCPLKLWRIITRTHRGGITSQSTVINGMNIKNDDLRVTMDANANIVTYHKDYLYLAKNYHDLIKLDMKDPVVDNL